MKNTYKRFSFLKDLSVEPILFVLYFALFSFWAGSGNLYLQKTCMSSEPDNTNEVCEDPDSISTSAGISTLRLCLREALAGITVLVAGAWKDRTGLTKPLMMLGLAGEILGTVVVMVGSFFWSSSPWIIASVECLVGGLTGGKLLVGMAANCYVAENSNMESRTSRFSRIIAAILLSGVIATACSGLFLSALGYKYFFILIIMLHICNLFMVIILIEDKPIERKKCQTLLSIATVRSVFKCGGNNAGIWMMILASSFIYVIINAEGVVSLYYLQQGFKYSVTESGYYNCFRMTVTTVSSVIISSILTKVFKMGDCKIAAISALLSIGGAVSMAYASTLLELILYTFLDVMKPSLIAVLKSILSKLLKSEEAGVYFGFESVVGSILPSVFLPLYDLTFSETLTTFPGAFYLISAGLEFSIFLLSCGTYFIYGEPGTVEKLLDIEAESKSQEEKNSNKLDESQTKDLDAEINSIDI